MSTMNICVLVYVCVSLLANAGLVLETMRRPFVRKASWTFYWAAIVAGGFVWSRCWMAYFTYDHPPEPGERDSVIAFWLIQYATCSVNTIFVLYHMWVLGKEERMLKPRTLRRLSEFGYVAVFALLVFATVEILRTLFVEYL